VPFSGKLRDDHGMARAEYLYTVTRMEAVPNPRARAALVAGALPSLGGSLDQQLAALAILDISERAGQGEQETAPEKVPLVTFDRALRDGESFETPLARLLPRLDDRPPAREDVDRAFVKEHILDQDAEFFDVAKLNLKLTDDKA